MFEVRHAEKRVTQLLRAEAVEDARRAVAQCGERLVVGFVAKLAERPERVGDGLRAHLAASAAAGGSAAGGGALAEFAHESRGDVVEDLRAGVVFESRVRPRDAGEALGVHAAEASLDDGAESGKTCVSDGRGAVAFGSGVCGDAVDGGGGVDGAELVAILRDDRQDVAVVGQGGELGLDGAAAAEIALTGGAATAAGGTATAAGASAGRRGVGLGGDGEATRSRRGEKAAVGDARAADRAKEGRREARVAGRTRAARVRPAEDGADVVDTAAGARCDIMVARGDLDASRIDTCALRREATLFPERGLTFRPGGGPARRKASTRGRGVRRGSGERHARRETARDGTGVRRLRVAVCPQGWGGNARYPTTTAAPGASGRVDTMRSASRWSTVQ